MSLADPPDRVRDGVFCQVFPDRFARSGRVHAPGPLEPWDEPPTAYDTALVVLNNGEAPGPFAIATPALAGRTLRPNPLPGDKPCEPPGTGAGSIVSHAPARSGRVFTA